MIRVAYQIILLQLLKKEQLMTKNTMYAILVFRFMADRSEELLPESSYCDASEAMGNIAKPTAKR